MNLEVDTCSINLSSVGLFLGNHFCKDLPSSWKHIKHPGSVPAALKRHSQAWCIFMQTRTKLQTKHWSPNAQFCWEEDGSKVFEWEVGAGSHFSKHFLVKPPYLLTLTKPSVMTAGSPLAMSVRPPWSTPELMVQTLWGLMTWEWWRWTQNLSQSKGSQPEVTIGKSQGHCLKILKSLGLRSLMWSFAEQCVMPSPPPLVSPLCSCLCSSYQSLLCCLNCPPGPNISVPCLTFECIIFHFWPLTAPPSLSWHCVMSTSASAGSTAWKSSCDTHVCACSLKLCPALCDPMDCTLLGSSVHGILSQEHSWECHLLLQGIFPTQRLNPCLLHWQADPLPLSVTWEAPRHT